MATHRITPRDIRVSDLAWIEEQEREVRVLRNEQLKRDGRQYDPILKKVVELKHDEPA